jgi:hypothetical protein
VPSLRRPHPFRRTTKAAAAPTVPVAPELAGQQLRLGWVGPELRERVSFRGERRVLVLHVPKTAGSSLRKMLRSHVPKDQTFLSTGLHQWADRSAADLNRHTLFVGHSFLEPLYLFPDDDWVTVLPVREPVSWWRSYYTYRRQRHQESGSQDPIVGLSFGDWVDSRSDLQLANPQASWLVERMRLMFDNPLCPPGRVSATGAVLRHDPGAAVQLLDRLVDRVTVVGRTENLHGLYVDVCAAMGWEPLHEEAVLNNVSRSTPEALLLTAAQERRLRDVTRIDRHLYDVAAERSARSRRSARPARSRYGQPRRLLASTLRRG